MSTAGGVREQVEILTDACVHVETKPELESRLKSKPRLTVKFGIDPTGSLLHLGHAVGLHKMQQFVELGHRVILLIGDFTARIGDPTGRNELRPPLTEEEIAANMRDYRAQAGTVLDLERVEVMYNSAWLAPLTFAEINRLAAHTTVAQMLARTDFGERYRKGAPIGLHEFLYPVAVAYDSVVMEADVELGASEQLFNLLIGREYQELFGQPKQICMTTPILVGIDGTIKMSKSKGNYVGLTESAEEQFGKLMSTPDEAIPEFARLAAFWSREEVEDLQNGLRAGTRHPMTAKKDVAEAIVDRYHGTAAARAARERFERTVQRGELPDEMPTMTAGTEWRGVTDAILAAGLAASRREAERLIAGGGVKIDGVPVAETRQAWAATVPVILSVGTRRFVRIMPHG